MKILTIILLLLSFSVFGDVYKRTADDGRVYYTDTARKGFKYKRIQSSEERRKIAYAKKFLVGKTDTEKLERRLIIARETNLLRKKLNATKIAYNKFNNASMVIGIINVRRYEEFTLRIFFLESEIKEYEKSFIANNGKEEDFKY